MMAGKCDVNEGQVRRKVTRKREKERNLKVLSGEKKGRRNFGEQVYEKRKREKYQSQRERERERNKGENL